MGRRIRSRHRPAGKAGAAPSLPRPLSDAEEQDPRWYDPRPVDHTNHDEAPDPYDDGEIDADDEAQTHRDADYLSGDRAPRQLRRRRAPMLFLNLTARPADFRTDRCTRAGVGEGCGCEQDAARSARMRPIRRDDRPHRRWSKCRAYGCTRTRAARGA